MSNNIEEKLPKEVRVWDPLIRIFHWSLVLAFTVAYLSGDEESELHVYAGYVILGLLVFRIVWGLVGSRFARFSNFVYSPQAIKKYLIDMLYGRPKHYLGHNPAGGAMIVAMLLSLIVVTYSGLKVYAIEEGAGPLAMQVQGAVPSIHFVSPAYADDDHDKHESEDDDFWEEFWEEIHEASANFVLFLVFLHIAGVFVSGKLHDENLVKAMITGNKKAE